MEKVQERALRFVFNDHVSSYSSLLQKAKKPSLYLNRLRKLSIEVHKVLNQVSPSFLNELYVAKETNYDLRDSNKVKQPAYNTMTYGNNSLRYQGAKLWNNLPREIKESTSFNKFRTLIQAWLGPICSCAMCILCQTRRQPTGRIWFHFITGHCIYHLISFFSVSENSASALMFYIVHYST